jgi:hypothetical protein
MRCSLCHQSLTPKNAWKGTTDRFYCSEFCSESEAVMPSYQHPPKELIDQQYVARLERLLPLRSR